MKYDNFITTNNTNIYEERVILRKWMEIKIDLFEKIFTLFFLTHQIFNFIIINNTHIYEERTILRKWICIKIDLIKII